MPKYLVTIKVEREVECDCPVDDEESIVAKMEDDLYGETTLFTDYLMENVEIKEITQTDQPRTCSI
jgi:hypothetical protein